MSRVQNKLVRQSCSAKVCMQKCTALVSSITINMPISTVHPHHTLMMTHFIFIRTADNLWVQEHGWLVSRAPSSVCRAPTSTPSSFWLLHYWTRKLRMSCSRYLAMRALLSWVHMLTKHACMWKRDPLSIPSSSHCSPPSFPHRHHHLKQCQQQKQVNNTHDSLEINVTKPVPVVPVKLYFREAAESSSKVPFQPPSLHLDAALHCTVSSYACNLHFPCGSNRNISIISRSFITRSPHRESLRTEASCVRQKALR